MNVTLKDLMKYWVLGALLIVAIVLTAREVMAQEEIYLPLVQGGSDSQTNTVTPTVTPSFTGTDVVIATFVPTETSTSTPEPTPTLTSTRVPPTVVITGLPTRTASATALPSDTPTVTATSTVMPTVTETATSVVTPQYPAEVLNISEFELNIAIGNENREISGEELQTFFDPVRFYVLENGIVCAVTEEDIGTTPNSSNVRCELQEIHRWTSTGKHVLKVTLVILQDAIKNGAFDNLVVCQIHDAEDDVAQCRTNMLDGEKVVTAHHDGEDGKENIRLVGYEVGDELSFELTYEGDTITYYVKNLTTGEEGSTSFVAGVREKSYFECCTYAQCSGCSAAVLLRSIEITHE